MNAWRPGWGRGVTGGNCPGDEPFIKKGWPYTIVRCGHQTIAIVPAEVGNMEECGTPSKAVVGSEAKRAALIASAPDLLACLKAYQAANRLHHDGDFDLFEPAEAAIAKAEVK